MPSITSFMKSQISHDDAMPLQFTVPSGVSLVGGELYTTPENEHVVVMENYSENELAVGIRRAERIRLKVLAADVVAVGAPLYLDAVNFVLTVVNTGVLVAVAKEAKGVTAADERIEVRFDSGIGQ